MEAGNTFKFLDQGGYGCVFRPEIVCDTNELGSADYISKIYRSSDNINDSDTQKEIAISNIIRKIPNYSSFFAPIIATCPVNIREYKSKYINEIEQCDILHVVHKDTNNNTTTISKKLLDNDIYYSAKMRYISNKLNKELFYLVEQLLEDDFVRKFGQTFQHVEIGLRKCYDAGFIHYDIKPDNILYDDSVHAPIIIDYGITVMIEDLTIGVETMSQTQLRDIFYTDQYYFYWCIEIFVISQFLYNSSSQSDSPVSGSTITEEAMKNVIKLYMENYLKNHETSSEESTVLYENYWGFYSQFVGKHWTDILKMCMEQKWYQTWDYYSLCISYLKMYTSLSNRRSYLKNNKKVQEMVLKWKMGVFSGDPLKRRV